MNDLLADPLFTVETPSGVRKLSLPGLLAALGQGEVLSYPALRRHQQDPFHVFLCQLAAASLARAGLTSPVQTAAFWREALLQLAQGQACAWQLVVEDPTLPAFMQPPALSQADFDVAFTNNISTPDELDAVILTGKDHDIKSSRASDANAEHWVYALVSLQTTAGYVIHYYGITRMNKGLGSRAIVSLTGDPMPSPRFRDETTIALSSRAETLRSTFGYRAAGTVLTWLKPWNRKQPIHTFSELDPLFVESARAIRVIRSDAGIAARGATNDSRQIGGPDNGDTGDPWTVLNTSDKKKGISALTLSASGFTAERLTDMLFEANYRLTPLQKPRDAVARGPLVFCASVLVRGQGTTDGFHSKRIPIPEKVRLALFGAGRERQSLGKLAKELLRDAGDVERSCLKTALFALCEGGPAGMPKFKAREVGKWVDKLADSFGRSWDDDYFPLLWRGAEPGADHLALRGEWVRKLAERARRTLDDAEQKAPIPSARKMRAAVRAETLLEAMLRKKGFAEFLKETAHVHSDD